MSYNFIFEDVCEYVLYEIGYMCNIFDFIIKKIIIWLEIITSSLDTITILLESITI